MKNPKMKIQIKTKCPFTQDEIVFDGGTAENAKKITQAFNHDNYLIEVNTRMGTHSFAGLNAWYFYSLIFGNQGSQELVNCN